MNPILPIKSMAAILLALLLGACAAPAPKYDYSAFLQNRPKSILVLPPQNDSPEVNATNGMLAHATLPLAESGYYVFPVTLVVETFRQNGVNSPAEIQQIPYQKLREIFGADSALYMNITQYGTSYQLIASDTRVTAEAKLIDLRSGDTLWTGSATASSKENEGSSNGGLVGLLVKAVVNQIVHTLSDHSYKVAGRTSARLLFAGRPNGILYGPRSPKYMTDGGGSAQ